MAAVCMPMHDSMCLSQYMLHHACCARKPQLQSEVLTPAAPLARLSPTSRYFLITQRGSTIEKELRAGLSTFLTVAYILAVNPHILSAAGATAAAEGHHKRVRRPDCSWMHSAT